MPQRKLTTKEFIQRARKVHGDRYDYSQVEYTKAHAKVTILCTAHGPFSQLATNHLTGRGCPACKVDRLRKPRKTQEEVVEEFCRIHGGRYDYSQVEYRGNTTMVSIKCTVHGSFQQAPAVHLRGCGCPRCGRDQFAAKQTKATKEFIQQAKKVHGDRYDYSQVEYIKGTLPVTLLCFNHGTFTQRPGVHLQGHGCPVCGREALSAARSLTQQDFLTRAAAVHGDRYDYSRAEYRDTKTGVTIICQQHGPFIQAAGCHLQGRGCPTCGLQQIWAGRRPTTEDFIKKARKVHGDRYDYSRTQYRGTKAGVELGCSDHGWFKQVAGTHLQGSGCPLCGRELQNKQKVVRAKLRRAETADKALDEAAEVHQGKYLYIGWEDDHSTIVILCPKHGVFRQDRGRHLQGQGCPDCARDLIADKRRSSTEEFIEKAIQKHGDRYDYSQVNYHHSAEPVTILCHDHGPFTQGPSKHLEGTGCPKCRMSRGEEAVMVWLQRHDVLFCYEWTDHDCRAHKQKAQFDFCLPDHKMLIEYDGKHHFEPVLNWYGGHKQTPEEAKQRLRRVQHIDRRKNYWAKVNNYTMIRIRYDENVADRLDQDLLPCLQ